MTNREKISRLLQTGKHLTTTEMVALSGMDMQTLQETIGSMVQVGLLKAHPVRYTITPRGRAALVRKQERVKRTRVPRSTRGARVVSAALAGRVPNSVFAMGAGA